MNILFDTYIYQLQKVGGINRYFVEIISRLPESLHPFLFGKNSEQLLIPSHAKIKNFWIPKCLHISPTLLKWRMRSIDLIHPSYYHLGEPLSWANIPGNVVITVYDFVMMRFAERYPRSEKVIAAQKSAIKRADHIICISHSTRRDLLEYFPECESRSCVIPLAGSLSTPQQGTKRPFSNRYFLYVGGRTFYKNFTLTASAFALLLEKDKELRLVVVGDSFNDEEKKLLAELRIQDAVILVKHPDDQMLNLLYQHSFALLYPSEYEGFGLPLLEGMRMGVPAIALQTSSIPEVVGEGGVLIESHKATPAALADAAISLLESESFYHQLSQNAKQQALRFSWAYTVEETVKVYQAFQ